MVRFAIAPLVVVALVGRAALGGELLLLDFTSPHCGPCQQMIPTIQGLEAAGYPMRKVDVTREPQLASQYGVTQVPCFVMLADGREVNRILGATSSDRLVALFQQARSRLLPAADDRVRTQSPDAMQSQDPWTGLAGNAGGVQSDPARFPSPAAGVPPIDPRATPPLTPTRPASADAAPAPLDTQLLEFSVRLRVDDSNGHSYGTGTIIDTRSGEALVITCGHLFRDSQGQGTVMVEVFAATPAGVRAVGQYPGQVISYNLDRDLGLVSIRPDKAVRVAPIASPQTVMDRGARVTSVGCDQGQDPTALATRVTAVNRYQGPPNIEASGAPVEGRSGGGLFNTEGELVGVCFAADYEGNEGLYTALQSIHDELDRLGLTDVYQSAGRAEIAAATRTATPPVVRGQEPPQPVMPFADSDPLARTAIAAQAEPHLAPTAAPTPLNPIEQAAWEEIMTRAADSEVICIIRPKQPGGKSEVIALPSVSPDFVRALADRARAVPATVTR